MYGVLHQNPAARPLARQPLLTGRVFTLKLVTNSKPFSLVRYIQFLSLL